VDDAAAFCAQHRVMLADIEKFAVGSLERLQHIEDALNALISPDPVRRDFLGHERLVATLYRAIKPDPAALEFAGRVACIGTIADAIRAKLNPNPADISEVMGDEELFEELVKLSRNLSEEQQRHVRENMTRACIQLSRIVTAANCPRVVAHCVLLQSVPWRLRSYRSPSRYGLT
jgi:hypothetical protein